MSHASLPFHLYLNAANSYLGPNMPQGTTPCIWHSAYSRPGQMLMCHVLLETGAHWSGLPLQALSSTLDFSLAPQQLMPWAAMGDCLEIALLPMLEGLRTEIMKPFAADGRHTGMIFDWKDGYSLYPQEHKPLSLIQTTTGQLALIPNNFMLLTDKHFTRADKRADIKNYKRGDVVYWED